jgi:hypothetical protein
LASFEMMKPFHSMIKFFGLDQRFFLWHHDCSSPLFAANCLTRLRLA